MRLGKIYSYSYMSLNFYSDGDDYFYEDEDIFINFDDVFCDPGVPESLCSKILNFDKDYVPGISQGLSQWEWAVEKWITKEENPEYFL